jgi:threonine dehydratase
MSINIEDIRKARAVIQSVVYRTQIHESRSCSQLVDRRVFLKLENQQLTGSFKIRGALNKISSLSVQEKSRGIIACSAGNHAQGVALAASSTGVQSTIVMPKNAPIVKIQATKNYGAKVILHGDVVDEAFEHAKELEKKEGYVFVHPYNDPLVIAGQGTIGLEVIEDLPDVDTIICPIGGGGLISGIATAVKALKPSVKIFGVQSRAVNSMMRSFHEGKIVDQVGRVSTIADGVAVKKPSKEILENYLKPLVEDIIDVSEDDIAQGIVFLMERAKTVVEGAGALAFAALKPLQNRLGKNVALMLCGGNIDMNMLEKVVHRGLVKSGRLTELRVAVEDKPGVLKSLTAILADLNCNVLEVRHDRNQIGIELGGTSIDFLVETSGEEHSLALRQALQKSGFRLLS